MTAQPDSRHELRWGFSTLGCPELTLPEVCRLAAQFHLRDLEVRALNKRTDLPEYAAEAALLPGAVRQLLEPFHGRIVVAGSDFKLTEGGGEAQRAAFLRFCDWAESWGIPYVRVFGGGSSEETPRKAAFAEAAQSIRWWREEKKRRNWRTEILLENHDSFCSSHSCVELNALLDQPLGIIWDTHHTWRTAGEKPAESWARMRQWVRHVHIKDSIDVPSAKHAHTYVLPGLGQMPLGEVIALLRRNEFAGVISLEWEKMWHPYLPDLREALIQLQAQEWFSQRGEPRPQPAAMRAAVPQDETRSSP